MSKRDDKQDDTLAEQCQVNPSEFDSKKYAKLIRADEREECAKLCVPILRTGAYFAKLIRARGKA